MIGRQFLRFAAVGGLATAVHYAILLVLVRAGMPVLAASGAGFVTSAAGNYALNRRFTFASGRSHGHAAPRFAVVALAGLACNSGLLALFHQAFGLHYFLAQLVATAGTLCLNFLLNRMWTFAADPAAKARP